MNKFFQERKTLKGKFQNRQNIFGAWTSIGHPQIAEILAKSGVDFIGIDIEHSTISHEQSQRIIAASQAEGIPCLPRIATHDEEMVKRLLDSGADGLIIPMINSAEEVQQSISWMSYPPQGIRSYGVARAQGYGMDFDQYVQTWNDTKILIIQIETQQGVERIDEILAFDDVDGVMIGPYDLSGSLGIPGQLDHSSVGEACQKVFQACQKSNTSFGNQIVEPNADNMEQALASGYNFIVLASDVFILWKWSQRIKDDIKTLKETPQKV